MIAGWKQQSKIVRLFYLKTIFHLQGTTKKIWLLSLQVNYC